MTRDIAHEEIDKIFDSDPNKAVCVVVISVDEDDLAEWYGDDVIEDLRSKNKLQAFVTDFCIALDDTIWRCRERLMQDTVDHIASNEEAKL